MYGVYVHIPWCRIHCPYCAFVVDTRPSPDTGALTRSLLEDWRRQAPPTAPETLYFGGGTPSLQPPEDIAALIAAIAPRSEVTLEVNPRTADRARLTEYRDAGVNRVSLGIQSFLAPVARRLGRGHRVADNVQLMEDVASVGFGSVSLDLIFGVPGQSRADWAEDLRIARSVHPDHVSLYGLTIEEGTPFHRAEIPAADEDLWREMYDLAVDELGAAGIHRYEVSNFARDGHRSVHNEHYWRARPWIGLGPGAHGWPAPDRRTRHTPDIDAWLRGTPYPMEERTDVRTLAAELIGSTIRHNDGLDRRLLRHLTHLDIEIPPEILRSRLVLADEASVRLSSAGFPIADAIAAALLEKLRPNT